MHRLKPGDLLPAAVCSLARRLRHKMLAVPGGGLEAERDRQVRLHSVHTDLELDLPPSIPLPDGEEIPYGSSNRLHIRDSQQESEIYQKCVRAPPNRTVFEGESPPPYRSPPAYRAPPDWSGLVSCHSLSSRYVVGSKEDSADSHRPSQHAQD